MPTRQEQIEGGLIGLLVGDALGVPYEFHDPESIPAAEDIAFEPPTSFPRAHGQTPPGTWSDDGAQALCLLDSLLECGRLDPEDLGRRFVRWLDEGYLAVDGRIFDVGLTTRRALEALRVGKPALQAGPAHESANGNGSLMRVLPLALWHRGTDAELAADARDQSRVTHGHLRAEVCCALYCLWARRILEGATDPWAAAVESFRQVHAGEAAVLGELDFQLRPGDPPQGQGTGYVIDCLLSARLALQEPTYETVVNELVALGHDTDTTACVAGGLAGLRDGIKAIPARWRVGLRGEELYRPLLQHLLEREQS